MSQALSPGLAVVVPNDSSHGYKLKVMVTPISRMWNLKSREVRVSPKARQLGGVGAGTQILASWPMGLQCPQSKPWSLQPPRGVALR